MFILGLSWAYELVVVGNCGLRYLIVAVYGLIVHLNCWFTGFGVVVYFVNFA